MHSCVICSLQVETSPQALPLGAACILSAMSSCEALKTVCKFQLLNFSQEEISSSVEVASSKMLENVLTIKPSFVFFSIYMWNTETFLRLAEKIKKKLPNTILICGGPEVTARPEFFVSKNSAFDYAIAGEGEVSSVLLLQTLLNDDSKNNSDSNNLPIKGVWSKIDDKRFLKGRSQLPSLEKLSSPYLDNSLNLQDYDGALWELARGCPFSCAYCYESRGEKTVRLYSLERIKEELQLFKKKNINQVFVLDPTYNADKKRALEILQLIQKNAPDIYFNFEVRAEFLDEALVKAFSKITCSLQIGLQSADPQILQLVNRSFNKKDFIKKIALLNDYSVIFGLDLMFGLPSDSVKNFLQSLDFAFSLYPNHLDVFKLSVLPGTALHEKGNALGLTWNKKPPYNVIRTSNCTEEDLQLLQDLAQAVSIFYSQGRAVTWFLAVIQPLKISASQFCLDFATWLKKSGGNRTCDCTEHIQIEKIQLAFLKDQYEKKKLNRYFLAVKNIVKINGAFCRALGEEATSVLDLDWNPEDLLGYDAMNIRYFSEEVCRETCRIKVFPSKTGPDFKFLD